LVETVQARVEEGLESSGVLDSAQATSSVAVRGPGRAGKSPIPIAPELVHFARRYRRKRDDEGKGDRK
ncbi:MAG TPA: hypothetical protein GX000_01155, partial [Actinomyces sp.]|nr:hypothetical protein [Actinomyces sp.]